ncbi:MAG: ferritin family protein [Deltaproteobacteria bacterium]|nr:ferritin family protein [Deltaproteobacteria bacterium]
MEKLGEMLSAALTLEEKGYKFYSEIVEKVSNEVGKTVFTMLRDDELVHIERIKEIYSAITNKEDWSVDLDNLPSHKQSSLSEIFRQLAKKHKDQISDSSDELKALEVGVEFESSAVKYYEKYLSMATEEKEKAFILKMIEEEKEHHSVLTDMQSFYTDPAAWFLEHEHPHLD